MCWLRYVDVYWSGHVGYFGHCAFFRFLFLHASLTLPCVVSAVYHTIQCAPCSVADVRNGWYLRGDVWLKCRIGSGADSIRRAPGHVPPPHF